MRPHLTPEERFWANVDKDGPIPTNRPDLGPCWQWQGPHNDKGYGYLWTGTKQVRVHRYAYAVLVGPIPCGLQIDHLCRNHGCVNSAHMELVTSAENTRRGLVPQRGRSKTQCPHGHPYDLFNTYYDPDGSRECRTCRRDTRARHNQRRREARPSVN